MPKSKRRKRSKSKSGYIGVTKNNGGNKYTARIRIDGKQISIGSSYDTAKQAAKAYDKEAIKLRRPLFTLNYPKKAPVGYTPIQKTLRSRNTVWYRGVSRSGKKKFQASIMIAGKRTNLGTYDTAKEAAIAYDRVVLKANKSTTLFLNFPDMVHNLDVEPKRNRCKLSSTGYKGVQKSGKKFHARIKINGKYKSLGTYNTAISAALAFDQAAIKKGNKKSTLNFPDGLPIKEKEKEIAKDGGYLVEGFIIQPLI